MDVSSNARNSNDEGNSKQYAKKKRIRRTSFTDALREKYCHNLSAIDSEFHIDIFVQGLPKNKESDAELGHIQNVVLNNSAVTHAGLPADGLHTLCPNVVDLDVSTNQLDSWEDLLCIFSQLPRLRVVNLSRNHIKSNMSVLQSYTGQLPKLEMLSLNSTGVAWPEVLALTRLFPDLQELHLCQNGYKSLEGLTGSHLQNLQALRLNNNHLASWKEVWRLGTLRQLSSLMLSENPITEVFYSHKCLRCDPAPHQPGPMSKAGHRHGNEDSVPAAMEETEDGNGNVFPEPEAWSGCQDEQGLCGQRDGGSGSQEENLSGPASVPSFSELDPHNYCLQILDELLESAHRGDNFSSARAGDAMSCADCQQEVVEAGNGPNAALQDCGEEQEDQESSNDSSVMSDNSQLPHKGDDSACSSPSQKNVWLRCPKYSRLREERAMSESEDGSEATSMGSPRCSEDCSETCEETTDSTQAFFRSNDLMEQQYKNRGEAFNLNDSDSPEPGTSSGDSGKEEEEKEEEEEEEKEEEEEGEEEKEGREECWCQGGDNPPFWALETLCLSHTTIDCWSHLLALSAFPQLRQLRVMNVQLWGDLEEEERRLMFIASLPKVEVLNGSEVTPTEREKAERHFLRFYLDRPDQRPPRYAALEAKHGAIKPLVDIDLRARFQEWANLSFFLSGKPKLYERIHVVKPVGKLRSFVATSMALPRTSFRMFHHPCGAGHEEDERNSFEELRFDSLPMSRYDLLDGDEIHVDIIKK